MKCMCSVDDTPVLHRDGEDNSRCFSLPSSVPVLKLVALKPLSTETVCSNYRTIKDSWLMHHHYQIPQSRLIPLSYNENNIISLS